MGRRIAGLTLLLGSLGIFIFFVENALHLSSGQALVIMAALCFGLYVGVGLED